MAAVAMNAFLVAPVVAVIAVAATAATSAVAAGFVLSCRVGRKSSTNPASPAL